MDILTAIGIIAFTLLFIRLCASWLLGVSQVRDELIEIRKLLQKFDQKRDLSTPSREPNKPPREDS